MPFVLFFAVLFGLKTGTLALDPPDRLAPAYTDQAHFRDEPAKAQEARNRALFGQWQSVPDDEYRFWRVQSPAWVYSEMLWFKAFGASLTSARAFALMLSLGTLLLLAAAASRIAGSRAALAAIVFLSLGFPYFVFSQLALMENLVLLFAVAGLYAFSRAAEKDADLRWLVAATAAFVLGCLSKQSGLLFAPLVGLTAWVWVRQASVEGRPARFVLAVVTLCVLGASLALYMSSEGYLERLAFNAFHFRGRRPLTEPLPLRALKTLALVFGSLAPVVGWLAVLQVFDEPWLRRFRRVFQENPVPFYCLIWIILVLGANFFSGHRAIRFHVLVLPPLALLAGLWFDRIVRAGRTHVAWAAVAVFLAWQATSFSEWLGNPRRSMADLPGGLTSLIGDRGGLVVGQFAPQAVLGTHHRIIYVRPDFNHDRSILLGAGITHLVSSGRDDFSVRIIEQLAPEILIGKRKLGTIEFRGEPLEVYALARNYRKNSNLSMPSAPRIRSTKAKAG